MRRMSVVAAAFVLCVPVVALAGEAPLIEARTEYSVDRLNRRERPIMRLVLERLPKEYGVTVEHLYQRNYHMTWVLYDDLTVHVVFSPHEELRPYATGSTTKKWAVPVGPRHNAIGYAVPKGSFGLALDYDAHRGYSAMRLLSKKPAEIPSGVNRGVRIRRMLYFF